MGPGRALRRPRRDPLHPVGRGHTLRYPPGPRPTPDHARHLEHSPHDRPSGPEASWGHRIDTWARQTKHADGITWFLAKLEAEARATPGSELLWSVPTARSDRAFNWGESAIAPDAVGKVVAAGLHVPFYLEYELRARHVRRLEPGGGRQTCSGIHQRWEVCSLPSPLTLIHPQLHPNRLPTRTAHFSVDWKTENSVSDQTMSGSQSGQAPSAPARDADQHVYARGGRGRRQPGRSGGVAVAVPRTAGAAALKFRSGRGCPM